MTQSGYIIRGGLEGRERLRVLSRVMQGPTLGLLMRAGLASGMACLEVACGGGDVARDIARVVGSGGRVVATDIDEPQLAIARAECADVPNLAFVCHDITQGPPEGLFDLVHARFLLTHLPNPETALSNMLRALRPGGILVIEDIDFRGYMQHPHSEAMDRYMELYSSAVRARGGDAYIGPRLPSMLADAGLNGVEVSVAQPAGVDGEVKLITPITMEAIAGAVLAEKLATHEEIDTVVDQLYAFARTPGTLGCMPRVVGAWGCAAAPEAQHAS